MGHLTDFGLGIWMGKDHLMSGPTNSDICVHTHTASPGNVWILSGFQCMRERGCSNVVVRMNIILPKNRTPYSCLTL